MKTDAVPVRPERPHAPRPLRLHVSISPDERTELLERARRQGLSLSDYVRQRALYDVQPKVIEAK